DGPCALGSHYRARASDGDRAEPAASEDRSVWAVCDGVLDDPAGLLAILRRAGHHPSGDDPAELGVHLYEDHGARFAGRMAGAWACAVWDRRRRELWLVRDRLGRRPLYYAACAEGVVFASELRGLAAHPWLSGRIDPVALRRYLTFGYADGGRALLVG